MMAALAHVETSLNRTYRYVRIGIALVVATIGVGVALAVPTVGMLKSISAYYYSPAQPIFVGALVAASLGLLALSGRHLERYLLDAAALFAPLIALIPTPVRPELFGYGTPCADQKSKCVPGELHANVELGIRAYLIVGALTVLVAFALGLLTRTDTGERFLIRQTWLSLVIAVAVLGGLWAVWSLDPNLIYAHGHHAATIVFFLIVAAIAIANATRQDWYPETPPTNGQRAGYLFVAIAIPIVIIAIALFVWLGTPDSVLIPWVFIGEAVVLALFVVVWIIQTFQKWHSLDPSITNRPDDP